MKLERERDIPAFKGKTWRERIYLRSQARERDHSIVWIQFFGGILTAPLLAVAYWLMTHFSLHPSLFMFVVYYVLLAYPVMALFYALFVTPRIRRALDMKPSA